MKYILTTIVLVLIAGAVWFFFFNNANKPPQNLPTAEEIKRMEEIEQSSAQIAPDAKTGVGVRPVGSIPPAPEPTPSEATTTEEVSEETL